MRGVLLKYLVPISVQRNAHDLKLGHQALRRLSRVVESAPDLGPKEKPFKSKSELKKHHAGLLPCGHPWRMMGGESHLMSAPYWPQFPTCALGVSASARMPWIDRKRLL